MQINSQDLCLGHLLHSGLKPVASVLQVGPAYPSSTLFPRSFLELFLPQTFWFLVNLNEGCVCYPTGASILGVAKSLYLGPIKPFSLLAYVCQTTLPVFRYDAMILKSYTMGTL